MIIGITCEAMSVKLCRTCVAWVFVVAPGSRHTMPCSGCGRTLAVLPGNNTMGNPICELCSDIERVKELLKESEAHIKSVNAYEWAVRYDMVVAAIKLVKNHLTEALATDSSSDQPMAPQGGQSPQGAASYGAGDTFFPISLRAIMAQGTPVSHPAPSHKFDTLLRPKASAKPKGAIVSLPAP